MLALGNYGISLDIAWLNTLITQRYNALVYDQAFIGNCIDGEGCALDNGNLQSYPCAYEGGCDHIYSNQMWELDPDGYLRDAQKCINGSTSCELAVSIATLLVS